MVAQRNSAIQMKSSVTGTKKNSLPSPRLRHKDESYVKKLELGLSIFRNKIQLRVDRCQEVLKRLDEDSKQMKICFLQLMDMIESSRKLISNEKEENLQILQLLDCYCVCADKTTVSSRTQTVSPMVYGIPLKKASISLKRLDPFQQQHVSTVIADSSPASAVGFARTAPRASLCATINPLVVTIHSSSSSVASSSSDADDNDNDDNNASSKTPLSRYRRCRTWNNVDNLVSSTSGQDFRLKTASILLKRLDPRSYLPETGTSDSTNINMAFQRRDIENNVFDTLYRAAVEINNETENGSEILSEANGQNHVSCPPANHDPMVVLERLVPSAWPCELDSHGNDLDLSIVHENCQSNYRPNSERKGKSNMKHKNVKTMLPQLTVDCTSTPKKRKSDSLICNVQEKQRVNCRINIGKGIEKEDSIKGKRRRTETNRKQKEGPMAVGASNKVDEDPLEGPSWLYKDGVKKEKLRKFKRIRQGYLTPLYYLAPTIYSSTDDSGDEATENERKRAKLRKKKQRKRN
ncbi:hypothetical protein R5R35_014122 [Gryllus longicercus]|uniref:Uncharacterized protein n=1 Tax=Gryllus longicercus TaxID=2509291 RepID=A0AAN9YY16_9ORTH